MNILILLGFDIVALGRPGDLGLLNVMSKARFSADGFLLLQFVLAL